MTNTTMFSAFIFILWQAGFTSPAQSGIMEGLNLSLAEVSVELLKEKCCLLFIFFKNEKLYFVFLIWMQFSFFGSVLTIGGLVGAAMSGRLADVFGRRGVSSYIYIKKKTNLSS